MAGIYVDGQAVTNLAVPSNVLDWTPVGTSNSGHDAIGAQFLNLWLYFNGSLDDIRIYDRSLTTEEIDLLVQGQSQTSNVEWFSLFTKELGIGTIGGIGSFPWNVTNFLPAASVLARFRAFDGVNYSDWQESQLFSINFQPSVSDGTVDGLGNQLHADPLPIFTWAFNTIQNGDTQSAYQIQINDANDFSGTVTFDSTKTLDTQSSFVYNQTPLTRGTPYYWRFRAWDLSDRDSDWSIPVSFAVNSLPSLQFGTITQGIGSGDITIPVNRVDNDGDTVTIVSTEYTIDSGISFLVPERTELNDTITWHTLNDSIGHETAQFRFLLNDGFENGEFILTPVFIVDNLPPMMPTITFPVDGENISAIVDVTWNAPTDPDNQESDFTYELQFSTNAGSTWLGEFDRFDTISTTNDSGSYSWNIMNLIDTSNAKIRMRTFDGVHYSDWAESAIFSIENTTPLVVTSPLTIGINDSTHDGRNIIIDGTTLTVNGSHTFSSLQILNNGIVNHSTTFTSTEYSVDLTILSDILIENGSKIDVSARGYRENRTLGNAIRSGSDISGGSYGGYGGPWSGTQAEVYGDFKNPNELGSGAGVRDNGGAGGGLVRITADSLQLDGSILANGQGYVSGNHPSGGSGGGIFVDVNTLTGTGSISAIGGNGYFPEVQ